MAEKEAIAKEYLTEIIDLQAEIDSLLAIPPTILTQVIYKQAEIDSALAKDSSNATQEYRKGLLKLQIRTDGTKFLSLREIGYGGLLFAELHGMRLAVPILNGTIIKQDRLIDRQGKLIKIKGNQIKIDSLFIAAQEILLQEKDSFFRHRFGIYLGLGTNYNGSEFTAGIQLGIGVLLWRND